MVVIELSTIIKLLPGLQFFSHSQLGLIDAQIPVWVRWADFAVGDGKICVKNLSDWSNDFVDGPRPAHTGSVFDEPFSVMFKREKKVYLELTDAEYRLVRKYLMDWRNKLTAQGRDAGPVNELLIKLMA